MITVNGDKTDLPNPPTVSALLEKLEYKFPLLVIRINGKLVKRDRYERTEIPDGAAVDILHLMSGG